MRFLRPMLWMLPALLLLSGAGQPDVHYVVQPGSRFYLDGTSTMGAYRCESDQVVGSGVARTRDDVDVTATLSIPVLAFDCGRSAMNRDFYEALKAETHPTIRITISHAALLDRPAGSSWAPVEALGTLRLAGATRAITLRAEGRRTPSGSVEIRGTYALRMTDYGIRPPTGLLGLVRAHNDIVASFNVVAVPE